MELSIPVLFIFLLFLLILVNKVMRPKPSNLPPGPWKLPLIGSLHHLVGGGLPHHTLRNLSKKHGPLMHLQLGEVSTFVVSSPRLAKEVMKTQDLTFANRPEVFAFGIVSYGSKDILFSPYGEYWRQLRKICTLELLSAKRVQSLHSVREDEVSNLIHGISSMRGSVFNLTERILSLANDITSRAALGERCKDKQVFLSMMHQAIELSSGFGLADLFPSLKLLPVISGMKSKIDGIHRKLDMILENILQEHKENRSNKDEQEEDLVDVLLRLQQDAGLGFPITTDSIKAVIQDMFIAGSETSSTVLDWTMVELLRNPRVMEKAQTEVRQVLYGKTEINETDIHELNYMKSVIKETLRVHPPAPLITRECKEKCEIDGYEIPVNTKIMVNIWTIGRDLQHWDDAEKFEPERFDRVSVDFKGTNFEYIPFGAGRRICPGITFGVANIELPLAQLLYRFDWKLPNGLKQEELDMTECLGSAVHRREHLYVIATPYNL